VDSAGNLTVLFNDYVNGSTQNMGTIQFAGLAPSLAGLYQINVQVPSGVLGAGDNVYVEFVTDFADIDQIQIPYGTSAAVKPVRAARPFGQAGRAAVMRTQGHKPLTRPAWGGATAHVCRPSSTRPCIP
jgi:hypothetical protein